MMLRRGRRGRTIEDPKVLRQLETLAMQTVEAQVSNAKNLAQAQAEKLAAEGRAAAGIARARGEAAVTQAQIDAENLAKLSQVRLGLGCHPPATCGTSVL